MTIPQKKANYSQAKKSAEELLNKYNILSPAVPVITIAEGEGLTIRTISLAKFRTPGKPVCAAFLINESTIFIEDTDSHERQRFSIAHEIGHACLHPEELRSSPGLGIVYRAPIGGETDPYEQEANCFAANLLVPRKMLCYWYEKTQNQNQLSEIFGVSPEVIGFRLINEKLALQ